MAIQSGNRPLEIFGYSPADNSEAAQKARTTHWCPFADRTCSKRSRLLDYPFGVCSVQHHGQYASICPKRFTEQGKLAGVPLVLEDVANHYFGSCNNVVAFSEVKLSGIGVIDFVLVHHKPMVPDVDDFVAVEFQSDSTTGTGTLVQSMRDFQSGENIQQINYRFGMNTYDSIKRSITQLFNKGLVFESWGVKSYWIIQEYFYADLVRRYGLKVDGYLQSDSSRFALYNLVQHEDRHNLVLSRIVSASVDEIYQAMRNNPSAPTKDAFVALLNKKLRAKLRLEIG